MLTKANQALRNKDYRSALELYEQYIRQVENKLTETHPLLYEYAKKQSKKLEQEKTYEYRAEANIVLTCSDSGYFNSLLLLIESVLQTSSHIIAEILVFDLGMEQWQINIIKKIKIVKIFNSNSAHTLSSNRYSVHDKSTYFFKSFAFYNWSVPSKYKANQLVNILWVDAGIKVQKNLARIYSIIDREGCFFVDHSDVNFYYSNPQNLLVNILSPSIEDGSNSYVKLSEEQLLRPYVKANFYGIQVSGPYWHLTEDYWDLCTNTDALRDPRNIVEKDTSEYWVNSTKIRDAISRKNITNSGIYLYGRHEQSIWSYLVARDGIKIYDSTNYNYTIAPGSGYYTLENYDKKIDSLLNKRFPQLKESMLEFINFHRNGEDIQDLNLSNDVNLLRENYISTSRYHYLEKPTYCNVGFPAPVESNNAIALLHRGSRARADQHKFCGSFLNFAGNINNDIFVLLGNGPSLGDVDLHSLSRFHTMGLNAAYRAYQKIGFWPKYFGCFDGLVCDSHSREFKELIKNSPIEKFFFININDDKKEIFTEAEILGSSKFQRIDFRYRTAQEKNRTDILSTSFTPFVDMRTSGSNSIQTALLLGYRKIILLGVDQNYIEVVDGAEKNKSYHKLIMKETPKANPNYWFSGYQQAGDKFNRPNLYGSQIPAWNNISATLEHLGIEVEIYNCSPITALECFKKASLEYAIKKLTEATVEDIPQFKSALK